MSALRSIYTPVQPSAMHSNDAWYVEMPPHAALDGLVYCYWQLRSRKPLAENYSYRVAADGCTDLYFEASAPQQIEVTGFAASSSVFEIGREFQYFGIRFYPSAFTQLTGIPAAELAGRSVSLQQVHPQLYRELLLAAEMNTTFAVNADLALLDFLKRQSLQYDSRFQHALNLILAQGGNMAIERELQAGISPRQLRRMFHHYIGASPKTFSKVVRFQHLLRQINSLTELRRSTAYFDSGYFDQAHFIREFKAFYGLTPAQAAQ